MNAVERAFAALGIAACVVAIVAERRRRAFATALYFAEAGEKRWQKHCEEARDLGRFHEHLASLYRGQLVDARTKRSQTTARGNATRAAKRQAGIEATAAELRRNVAERGVA